MNTISLTNISCEKQNRLLFSELELHLSAGELLYLRGENGAGKTSLLRIIVGLSMPTTGEVRVWGESVTDRPDILRSLIYVGHKSGNSPSLSAVANLTFWVEQFGLDINQAQIISILQQLQLEGLEDLPVRNLSAGQQRRVALARLWLHEQAKLWVLDEPFTALDVHTVDVLSNRIANFVNSGGSVVMTSHQAASIDCPSREFTLEYAW